MCATYAGKMLIYVKAYALIISARPLAQFNIFFVMFAVAGVEEAGRSPIISLGGSVSGLGGRLVSLQTKLSFLNHPDLNDLKKWANKPGAATADKFEAARRRKMPLCCSVRLLCVFVLSGVVQEAGGFVPGLLLDM